MRGRTVFADVSRFASFASLALLCAVFSLPAAAAPDKPLLQCSRVVKSCGACQPASEASRQCAAGQEVRLGPPGDFDAEGCPRQCQTVSCIGPVPADSQRFRPLTEHSHPWGVPSLRKDHPRLYLDASHLARLKARWTDPAYADVVREYRLSMEPLSQAITSLATNDPIACRLAARTVANDYKPNMSLSSGPPGGTEAGLFGPPETTYADPAALIFDWCYEALTPELKTRLIAQIEKQNQMREDALNKHFQWHESFFSGFHAYLLGVLAIEGETGASSRLQKAQNALQNWTEIGNELHGDGSYKTYTHQDLFFVTPAVLWSMATGQDVVHRNQFILHHAEFLLRRLSPDAVDFVSGPGDQASDPRGMIIGIQDPSALGPLMIADYLHDGFAQWVGELILKKQGAGRRRDNPRWLELLFRDDALKPVPPAQAGIPLVRDMAASGMVDMRSEWDIGAPDGKDIDAWFYLGPATEHSELDAGHFTVWRGNDDLITEGDNYFSRPTRDHELWSALSFARNTMEFSPAHAKFPDLEGGQTPPGSMVYDDGRLYGDVGASYLVNRRGEDARNRIARLSAEKYPVANRVIWYSGYATYLGEMNDFRDLGDIAIATGDASAAYDPLHVKSYSRTVIDVKPDVFIIRDRFDTVDVDRIRMLFHHRERPDIGGFKPVQGTTDAGILESDGNKVTVTRGGSQAVIEILWPPHPKLRLVGGPGFDQYIDGVNIDAKAGAADWLNAQPDFPARLARVHGVWRTEIETTPQAAEGEMIVVVSVGARGAPPISARYARKDGQESIEIHGRDGKTTDIELPGSRAGATREIFACRP